MTATLEERVRDALAARADQITPDDLRPAAPPSRLAPAEPGVYRQILARWKPVLVAAAAAACAIAVITWLPRDLGRNDHDNGPASTPGRTVAPSESGPDPSPVSPYPVPTGAVPSGSPPVTSGPPPTGADPQPTTSAPLGNPGATPTSAPVASAYPTPALGGGSPTGPGGTKVTTVYFPPPEPQSSPARPAADPS